MSPSNKNWTNPRPRANTNWQHLSAGDGDDGRRWRIVWDTTRRPESETRSTALEKSKDAALDRARHMLRMGFIVYEVREPSGVLLLDEPAIRAQLGKAAPTP
ncbi:MAG TPA: hypothetical protein VG328_11390 [Stellaceae bacterium]|jgi:hypothetical protein|nr:hypothetical protein [Stellaceae bacterium]